MCWYVRPCGDCGCERHATLDDRHLRAACDVLPLSSITAAYRQTDTQTPGRSYTPHTDRHTHRQTPGRSYTPHTDRQTDRHQDVHIHLTQTDKQTDTRTWIYTERHDKLQCLQFTHVTKGTLQIFYLLTK